MLRRPLENTGLLLQPAHILDDLIHIVGGHPVDLGHVPEFPVVGLHSVGSRSLEGGIPMMVRFINFMDQRGPLTCTDSTDPMAGSTVGFELALSRLHIRWDRTIHRRLGCGLSLTAGRSDTHNTEEDRHATCP